MHARKIVLLSQRWTKRLIVAKGVKNAFCDLYKWSLSVVEEPLTLGVGVKPPSPPPKKKKKKKKGYLRLKTESQDTDSISWVLEKGEENCRLRIWMGRLDGSSDVMSTLRWSFFFNNYFPVIWNWKRGIKQLTAHQGPMFFPLFL